jgi:hypothetical protein
LLSQSRIYPLITKLEDLSMSGRQVALQVEVKGFIEQAENVVLL